MIHRARLGLELLCLAATFLVAVGYAAHAASVVKPAAQSSDSDTGAPCSGGDAATQTGNCDSQAGDLDEGQAGDIDDGQVGDQGTTDA